LPPGHRFPGTKYGLLRKALLEEKILREEQLIVSPLAETSALLRAHDPDYVKAMETGAIDARAMRRIGFPWSGQIVQRARATIGGAVAAARSALEDGLSGQLAGGTHHAHYDFGAGYCIYNDFACAALAMLAEQRTSRVAIIDLDVHQGDGNAAILSSHSNVFVLSIHGEKNFPFRKIPSDIDVNLPDDIEDGAYLEALKSALKEVWDFDPELILYQSGVDPLSEDKLGRMNLTHDGLKKRDEIVLSECYRRDIPISMAIGGGYADPIEASVTAYANTYRIAKEIYSF